MQQSTIFFYGGAGAVTGANFLLDSGKNKILVDCGLRQGRDDDEAENWKPFAYNPAEVSHLIITHAHIDHIGRIPKLVKDGFKGTILSTPATKAIAEPLLMDAMEIMAHEARNAGRELLYEASDVKKAFELWQPLEYHHKMQLPDDIELELMDAGHILGSAMVRLTRGGKVFVMTGDLGGGNSPLLGATDKLTDADYLMIESVYGDRTRPEDKNRRDLLENVIEDSVARGGTLLIPAFSTERTQDLLFEIRTLMMEKRIPTVPVYVDSPLAQKVTRVFEQYQKTDFSFPQLHFTETVEESAQIKDKPTPKIVLAGSGMGSGGRIRSHERYVLPDPKSTLLIVGYQAVGTIGRRLLDGEKTIKLERDTVKVVSPIEAIFGYSAHMDGEGLLEFVNKNTKTLSQVFVVEGEPASAAFLAQRIRDYLGTKAITPEGGDSATIDF
jgi:metallo-beta-lactamase family protein